MSVSVAGPHCPARARARGANAASLAADPDGTLGGRGRLGAVGASAARVLRRCRTAHVPVTVQDRYARGEARGGRSRSRAARFSASLAAKAQPAGRRMGQPRCQRCRGRGTAVHIGAGLEAARARIRGGRRSSMPPAQSSHPPERATAPASITACSRRGILETGRPPSFPPTARAVWRRWRARGRAQRARRRAPRSPPCAAR